MKPEQWSQIEAIYHAALERMPDERAAYLAQACAGDAVLRREVESLLVYDAQAADFIEQPAIAVAAQDLAEEQSTMQLGQRISHYQLLSRLGAGGMGEVFLAQDTSLNRQVALKLLPRHSTAVAERVQRFEREARAASALNHPNILTIHEIGQVSTEAGDTHFIVTEYVEGQTLRQRMKTARMSLPDSLDVALQIASALAAAHAAGIIHRDIKPENVIVRPDGLVKVLDFGLAKLTEMQNADFGMRNEDAETLRQGDPNNPQSTAPGIVLGTPRYMSPEQARGEKVDARTDIFSLGVMLYEMIAGHAPFVGATPSDVMAAILRDEPKPLRQFATTLPDELEEIVAKTLEKDRETRYQHVQDLSLDLKRVKQHLEIRAELERTGRQEKAVEGLSQSTAGDKLTRGRNGEPQGRKSHLYRRGAVIVCALLIIVTGVLAYLNREIFWEPRGSGINSIVVLPFANADPNTEYFSDGISESLINRFSRLAQLKVIARTTAFQYKGKVIDPQSIGRELKIDAVLMGRVVQQGESLIVQADLVNTADGAQLWGERFNRKLADIFNVQDEIAQQITETLRVRLTGEQQKQLTNRHTNNFEAHGLYLKGRFFWEKRTAEALQKAIEYYQQAIALDPNFALPYVGLVRYDHIGAMLPPRERAPRLKEFARKALALDETLGEAHTVLAWILFQYDWNWAEAEREFRRGLELDPNSALAHKIYGYYLAAMERHEEGIAELKRAQQLDPLSLGNHMELGTQLFHAGRFAEAVEQFQKTQELEPNAPDIYKRLGMGYAHLDRYEEAVAALEKGLALEPENDQALGILGYTYGKWGKREAALRQRDKLRELARQRYISDFWPGLIYSGLREKDQAFAHLQRACQERFFYMVFLKVDPKFDNLRTDARFAELLRCVGLPQ